MAIGAAPARDRPDRPGGREDLGRCAVGHAL